MIYLIFHKKHQKKDELVIIDYNENEIDCRQINDLIEDDNCELSDINGSNDDKHLAIGYRHEQEFGIYIYRYLNSVWVRIEKVKLNECDVNSYFTPRICWINQLDLYSVIDFKSGDMIMINCKGELNGKRSYICTDKEELKPINICSPKNKNWLAICYETLISIHTIID
ncbi:unnamed protein product [Didymodactylos carnosus]|uniref:Uncharacterized protein n=1 Tax=Didymodactylos carnosus TaxID=1234261 RepID=A0A815E2T5_9BILA|nr:unnamed protein product [Didymodactylos carnosus]CAF1309407.1 unnamed protein product [Didymodactylos carnosus]CAF4012735.1 unnamed protein product [Didymodactylos carnosus]CAF4145472.1 unnamed protein product [Didymodactylos carnosus]